MSDHYLWRHIIPPPRTVNFCTVISSSITIPLLPSLYYQGSRLDASGLKQRYPSILDRQLLTTGMYRLLEWYTPSGLLQYPSAVDLESDKALYVMTLKILLPVRRMRRISTIRGAFLFSSATGNSSSESGKLHLMIFNFHGLFIPSHLRV